MLIHVRPCFFSQSRLREPTLLSLKATTGSGAELMLLMDDDLRVGRPYPNKHYLVPSRRVSGDRMSRVGLFFRLPDGDDRLCLEVRWRHEAVERLHAINYRILDREFGGATDAAYLWCANQGGEGRNAASRWPDVLRLNSPMELSPVFSQVMRPVRPDGGGSVDDELGLVAGRAVLKSRTEDVPLPSIPLERLSAEYRWSLLGARMPRPEDVFEFDPHV